METVNDYSFSGADIKNTFNGDSRNEASKSDIKIIDKDWITSMFMVGDDAFDDADIAANRYWSTADNKFTDTSIGGNIGINTRPQFTRFADIRNSGTRMDRNQVSVVSRAGNLGMGRYYSEAIDDNAQVVFMEFGIPKFNSLFDYLTNSVDYVDSVVANTGRSPIGYRLGQLVGNVAVFVAFPLITTAIWIGKTALWVFNSHEAFSYYYLDPTMHAYWGSVNTIVTQMATEMGILAPYFTADAESKDKQIGTTVNIDQRDIDELKKLMPGIIGDNNYIDVFAIATRAQALANKQMLKDKELFDKGEVNKWDFKGYVKRKYSTGTKNVAGSTTMDTLNQYSSFSYYLSKLTQGDNTPYGEGIEPDKINSSGKKIEDATKEKKNIRNPDMSYAKKTDNDSYLTKMAEAFDSSVRDGGTYLPLRVDYIGSISESFSNSVKEIDTKDKIKSIAKKSRDVKFNFSGGNILGDTVNSALGYVKDFAMGAVDSLSFGLSGVLQSLMGGAYMDIPKQWDDSEASLPQVTYTMQLISPYGNTYSQLQNIYIPLACILAGALPRSTGKASYTSPFLCSTFVKGVQKTKMGMITSLNITRGTSNLGFSRSWKTLAIDVSFTVTDFSSIMSAPVNSSIFGKFLTPMDDDSMLGQYIAIMGSRDLLTSKYAFPKAKLRMSRMLMNLEQAVSPASMGMRLGEPMNAIMGPFVAYNSLSGNLVNQK